MPDEPFTATVVISAGGPAGPPGTAATVDAGTTTTGSPGTNAAVTNVGTTNAAVFNFTIPRGATGAAGATGPAGPAGAGSGDVIGPGAVTTANHVVLWSDGTGTAIKDSGGTFAGTNTGDQTITLTGDVTGTGTGSFVATIANDAVTYAKMQNVSTTDRLLGRSTAGSGDVQEIVCTAAGRAILDDTAASDQRTTLGLGTLATQSGTFSGTHSGTSSGTNTGDQDLSGLQPLDSDLTAIAGLTTDTFGRGVLTQTSAANTRTYIGAGTSSFGGAFSDLTGNIAVSQMNSGTSASSTTFFRGDGVWGTPAGAGTVTADNSLATNAVVLGGASGTTATKVVAGIISDGSRRISLGVATSLVGQLEFFNATSGSIVLQPETGALSTGVITIPTEPSGIMATRGWVATANTTGSAGSLSVLGQTGLLSVTGLTSTNRIKTVRDAADTILELGGSYTPTGTWTSLTMVTPVLGTPTSGTLTNCTLPVGGVSGLGTGVGTFLATPSSANLATAVTDETGSGALVFATSPTFVTPLLGTPTSGTLTNCTFPTLNQNSTGSAASLSVSGQTGLMTVTGLTSTNRAKTVRDAADTILELGGSYTPTGTWTNLTMVTPVLGTPTSGLLNNCTATSTSTAWGIGTVELGHATDTTIARASAGKITVEGVPVMLAAPRVTTISSNATWSPNADTDDIYEITGQTVAATTISNPSGTPVNGQKLTIRATGTAARALTWSGSKWRASSDLALPTTTTTTKTLYCGFIYNTAGSGTWDMVAFLDNF